MMRALLLAAVLLVGSGVSAQESGVDIGYRCHKHRQITRKPDSDSQVATHIVSIRLSLRPQINILWTYRLWLQYLHIPLTGHTLLLPH